MCPRYEEGIFAPLVVDLVDERRAKVDLRWAELLRRAAYANVDHLVLHRLFIS